jgi:predicted AAA+ superfamily ATPase
MKRDFFLQKIEAQFRVHPICAILGPRQVGKTTLAKMYEEQFFPKKTRFFDLENPLDLAQLENPMLALSSNSYSLIIIDEIQRRPELFPVIRVLVDQEEKKRHFLVLGSASR